MNQWLVFKAFYNKEVTFTKKYILGADTLMAPFIKTIYGKRRTIKTKMGGSSGLS